MTSCRTRGFHSQRLLTRILYPLLNLSQPQRSRQVIKNAFKDCSAATYTSFLSCPMFAVLGLGSSINEQDCCWQQSHWLHLQSAVHGKSFRTSAPTTTQIVTYDDVKAALCKGHGRRLCSWSSPVNMLTKRRIETAMSCFWRKSQTRRVQELETWHLFHLWLLVLRLLLPSFIWHFVTSWSGRSDKACCIWRHWQWLAATDSEIHLSISVDLFWVTLQFVAMLPNLANEIHGLFLLVFLIDILSHASTFWLKAGFLAPRIQTYVIKAQSIYRARNSYCVIPFHHIISHLVHVPVEYHMYWSVCLCVFLCLCICASVYHCMLYICLGDWVLMLEFALRDTHHLKDTHRNHTLSSMWTSLQGNFQFSYQSGNDWALALAILTSGGSWSFDVETESGSMRKFKLNFTGCLAWCQLK